MIDELKKANQKALNMILYIDNDAMQYYARNIIKDRFNCSGDYIEDASTYKELHRHHLDMTSPPMVGDRWMLNVDTTKISKNDIIKELYCTPQHVITVYWVSKYALYKELINSDIVKKQGIFCYTNFFGRLTSSDIYKLFAEVLETRHEKPISDKLIDYVAKNYQYDPQGVFDLISYIKSGNEFETTKDIIETIGLGGNTVDSFTLNLLMCNVSTLKGKKTAIRKYLKAFRDLSYSYKYSSIKNFMLNTVNGFIDMKQLQIMGKYRRGHYRIPDCYDSTRLSRLRRYEWAVLDTITLPRLLLLKKLLIEGNNISSEVSLMEVIIGFIDALCNTEAEEINAINGVKPITKQRKPRAKKKVLNKKDEVIKSKSVGKKPEVIQDDTVTQGTQSDGLAKLLGVIYGNKSINTLYK